MLLNVGLSPTRAEEVLSKRVSTRAPCSVLPHLHVADCLRPIASMRPSPAGRDGGTGWSGCAKAGGPGGWPLASSSASMGAGGAATGMPTGT